MGRVETVAHDHQMDRPAAARLQEAEGAHQIGRILHGVVARDHADDRQRRIDPQLLAEPGLAIRLRSEACGVETVGITTVRLASKPSA